MTITLMYSYVREKDTISVLFNLKDQTFTMPISGFRQDFHFQLLWIFQVLSWFCQSYHKFISFKFTTSQHFQWFLLFFSFKIPGVFLSFSFNMIFPEISLIGKVIFIFPEFFVWTLKLYNWRQMSFWTREYHIYTRPWKMCVKKNSLTSDFKF